MLIASNNIVKLIVAIWMLTLGRSILIMCGGSKLFDKALKGAKNAYIPIINLFVMLEIGEISTFLGILLFIPGINLIILVLMSYKVGKVFEKSDGFILGMMFLPIIFYPLLFRSDLKYKYKDENYFLALDSARADNINLMTQDEIQEINNTKEENTQQLVDSIFKSELEMIEPTETYKAVKIDNATLDKMDDLPFDDNTFAPIERVDLTSNNSPLATTSQSTNTQNNSFITEIENKEENTSQNKFVTDDNSKEEVEFIDL